MQRNHNFCIWELKTFQILDVLKLTGNSNDKNNFVKMNNLKWNEMEWRNYNYIMMTQGETW